MSGAESLSLIDLNTEVNHEPRILDVRLGERLGMFQPLDIRRTIEANRDEIQRYGVIFARRAKNRTLADDNRATGEGTGPGRPGTEFWLNEAQTLLVCMFSRTERAADVRQEVIEVYMAYRRGLLAPALDMSEIAAIEAEEPPERLSDRFAEECTRLGFDTPEAFAKYVGWRGNKLYRVMTLQIMPKKIEDIWMLLGLGFDVPYLKWRTRSALLRAPALLQTWQSLPPERRALLLGETED